MKKYSSKRASKGKTAYRTPSTFRQRVIKKTKSGRIRKKRASGKWIVASG